MTNLVVGLVGALLATNQPAAVSNLVTETTGLHLAIPDPNDPVERELSKIEEDDDTALSDVDRWISEHKALEAKGAALPPQELSDRITARFNKVRGEYEDFIKAHPDHVKARLAYGGFLQDIHDEDGARDQTQKAVELDPKNPAAWNNLAIYYGHVGPVAKMFEYYGKAIELNPMEPIYLQNLADAVYIYRKDAREYYKLNDDQEVFNKALDLYRRAFRLAPNNFDLATELANSYYGIKPTRTEEALAAWTNALNIAPGDIERQGVLIHLARFKFNANRFAEARRDLDGVNETNLQELKTLLLKNIETREKEAATNAPPVTNTPAGGR